MRGDRYLPPVPLLFDRLLNSQLQPVAARRAAAESPVSSVIRDLKGAKTKLMDLNDEDLSVMA